MKSVVLLLFILFLASVAFAGDVDVRGYWKDTNRDGIKDTWVQPHHRTAPNNTTYDNYSTYPNVNPYTGEQGTVKSDHNYNYNYDSGYGKHKKDW